jgi:hypothetical protein
MDFVAMIYMHRGTRIVNGRDGNETKVFLVIMFPVFLKDLFAFLILTGRPREMAEKKRG